MANIDKERVERYLDQISHEIDSLNNIIQHNDDEQLLRSPLHIRSIKYSLIVITEAMSNTLQHILAKDYKISVSGYKEVFVKAKDNQIISFELFESLKDFANFRNMLVHQYWKTDDKLLIENLRAGIKDFEQFIKEILQRLE